MESKLAAIVGSLSFLFITGSSFAQESGFHEAGSGLSGGLGHSRPDSIFDHPEDSFGLFLDGALTYEDELDAQFTSAEAVFQSRFASDWLGFAVLEANDEEIRLSELAVSYYGLGGNTSLGAGRFFLDFGKQMQTHVHDISTPSRPAVLREYLGEEASGDGVQFDHWAELSGGSTLRFSVAAFDAFESHSHGEGEHEEDDGEHEHGGEIDQESLGFGARLTTTTHLSDGVLQLGASYRGVPEYTALSDEVGIADVGGLSNDLVGLDLTYAWGGHGHGHGDCWSVGGEYLSFSGDLSAGEDEVLSLIDVYRSRVSGWYAFADHQYEDDKSYGVMLSAFEHPEAGGEEDLETTLYHTWNLSDATRVRLALVHRDSGDDGDSLAGVLQLTGFFGDHGHAHAHAHSH
jgi:hypothetical protein